jgi:hypothetical protein
MPDLAESLDEFLNIDTDLEQQSQKSVIDDDNKADWAVRKIIKLQQKTADAKKLAAEQIAKIKEWQSGIEADNDSSIEFFLGLLRPYAEQQLDGKKKTVKLPSGNISFHSRDPVFFIAEEKVDGKSKKLTDQIEKLAPQFIITEKSTNWTEFKNTLTVTKTGQVISADGEILDFLTAIEYPDSVSVKERK